MEHELNLPNIDTINPLFTGLATFIAFIFFGIIPLLPFMFGLTEGSSAFILSSISTFMALVLLGIVKWRVIGTGLIRSVGEIVFIGGSAAIVAFIVGVMFS